MNDFQAGNEMCTRPARNPVNATREFAVLNSQCVVCGLKNTRGLRIQFSQDSGGTFAIWNPTRDLESFKGTIHGGMIAAVLDEAMSKAIVARDLEAFTAELRLRYKAKIAPGDRLKVRGWIVRHRSRHIEAEATIESTEGKERAHGWGTFLIPRRS